MISQSPTHPVLKGLLWPIYRHGVINPQLPNVAKSPDVGHNIRPHACAFGMVTMASTKRSLMQLETKDIQEGLALYIVKLRFILSPSAIEASHSWLMRQFELYAIITQPIALMFVAACQASGRLCLFT